MFLIVANLEAHEAGRVQPWVAQHRDRIELFFLPAYAPDHNPDAFLPNDREPRLGRRPAATDRMGSSAACAATCAGCSASPSGCGRSSRRQPPAALLDPYI
ncbi:transposase [Benzoatithermus flavus]|uniref:transposase n=1 Tax=Benzoatithermus flavus TaxID=3108223 RepID=UPI003AADADA0